MSKHNKGLIGAFIAVVLTLGVPAFCVAFPNVMLLIMFTLMVILIGLVVAVVGYEIGSDGL